ncbi:conserved hypothetical protein [Sphingorhabdus sp. 109]|jgi:hypothetical protein|nr:conserved hypothetical protein [Sphingorhabdus sp. 109]
MTPKEQMMMKLFKSDLTYSLGGGFIAGALMLFFMQPADQPSDAGQTLSSTVSAVAQIAG